MVGIRLGSWLVTCWVGWDLHTRGSFLDGGPVVIRALVPVFFAFGILPRIAVLIGDGFHHLVREDGDHCVHSDIAVGR